MHRRPELAQSSYTIKYFSKRNKSILKFILLIAVFAIATPALADYLGPNRVVTETTSACKVILYSCQYVPAKDEYRYKRVEDWLCSNESKPWQAYDNVGPACEAWSAGRSYWEREETVQQVTVSYPPATISSSLQNCTLNNGWCITPPQLSLKGSEPVAGYSILAVEGTRNGQTFACSGANCSVQLNEGNNSFSYWALSSWGDSSTMGTLTAKVDTQLPNITGTFSGTLGSNGWYITPVSFTGNASDATSGLASFTCTLDGNALGSCNSININSQGPHTVVLTARDNAGRTRTISQNASLDTQNPVLTAALSGMAGSNNWYTNAELNASASDPAPGSGLAALEYKLDASSWTTFPVSGALALPDGKHTVDVRAVDNAGHTVASSKSFWLDTIAPNILLEPTGTLGLNGWYTTNLNLSAFASDSTSGVDLIEYSLNNNAWTTYLTPLTLMDGTHSLSFWVQDFAELASQVDRSYKVDTRPPQIAGSLSGIPGTNGWYISDVTLSASAADPALGSGIETFTYILNGDTETPYAAALPLSDGQHTIQLNAKDKAGLSYSTQQTIKVDTIYPSLNIQTTLPNWIKDSVVLNGTASDNGSGLLKVEISTDSGQTWQPMVGTTSWGYTWNTQNSLNGIRDVHVRAIDNAGLITKRSFSAGVDNRAPKISLPDSWYQWDTVTLDIWDDDSGLSEARVEISDPEGRWPARIIRLGLGHFPLDFKWDRRFGDDTVAPLGIYNVRVVAFDNLGNMARESASIKILLDILPAGPTATPQPTTLPLDTSTLTPTQVGVASSPTQTPVVSVFGALEPTAQVTPAVEIVQTPRATPVQTNVLDWLQSIFVPDPNAKEHVTEFASSMPMAASQSSAPQSNVLWGAAAAGVIGAATAYALEEKRKREEEQARQAEEVRAKVDAKNEAIQASQQAKREALMLQNWLQGQAMLNAQIEEAKKQGATSAQISALKQVSATQGIGAAIDGAINLAQSLSASTLRRNAAADVHVTRKEALVEEEMKAIGAEQAEWVDEYDAYMAQKAAQDWHAGEKEIYTTPPKEKLWWENTKSFVWDEIIQPLNENVFQPFVKPAMEQTKETLAQVISWADENVYQPYVKPAVEKTGQFLINEIAWINENIYQPFVKPVVEKVSETITHGISWANEKIYQPHIKPAVEKISEAITNGISWTNKNIYQPYIQPVVTEVKEKVYQPYIEPVVRKINETVTDVIAWTNEKIYEPFVEPIISDINQYIYQPLVNKVSTWWEKYGEWVHGALDAVGFIPGLGEIADGLNGFIYLGEGRYLEASLSAMAMIPLLGDLGKAGKLSLQLGEEMLEKAAKEAAGELIEKAAKESLEQVAEKTVKEAGELASSVINAVGPDKAKILLESLDEDVLDYVVQQGSGAIEALSLWSKKDLKEHGVELALRAEKDAQVFADVKSLIKLGPIDPKHLTPEQQALINAIAANSTQYADEGQVVLGKWVDFGSGFVESAQNTGSVHYNPHPDMWKLLGNLGKENRSEVAWLINKQVIQTGIDKGLPFEYTLNDIPADTLVNEDAAIQAIFSGKTDAEIMRALKSDYIPIRMKELQELQKAGYEFSFDEVTNSYVLIP